MTSPYPKPVLLALPGLPFSSPRFANSIRSFLRQGLERIQSMSASFYTAGTSKGYALWILKHRTSKSVDTIHGYTTP